MKKLIIIGAGPGGLSSGMILASKGYKVVIYEKNKNVGGRNNYITLGDYKFDLGPTFLMYLPALEDVFRLSGKNIKDYLEIIPLDPLYKISYDKNDEFYPRATIKDTIEEIKKTFPGEEKSYEKYIKNEGEKFEALMPCFKIPYGSIFDLIKPRFLKTIPKLDLLKTLLGRLKTYFKSEKLQIALTFQSKYLGMSPFRCPASFTILSYIEHKMGIYHVKGGLNEISNKMGEIIKSYSGKIHLNTPVKEIIIKDGTAIGVELENGEKNYADYVILNADFSYGVTNLIPNNLRNKYTNENISKKGFSCSTLMFYLGIDKIYKNLNHHNIIFNKDYKKFAENISEFKDISDDFSFYIHNPSILDKSLAPEGHSCLYILVPTPNNISKINWEEKTKKIYDKILLTLKERFGIDDLESHIKQKHIITPKDWETKYNIYSGAVFNLANNLGQMLYFRPHNEFEDAKNMFIVGGGTHPGSGLPTIYYSGIISSEIILKKDGKI